MNESLFNMYFFTSLIAASIVSFVISSTICPFGRKLLKENPRTNNSVSKLRQMHEHYVPRIGGLGIVTGFWVTIALILVLGTGLGTNYFLKDARIVTIYWIAGLSIAAFGLGFLDDIIDIRARYKLLIQILIAAVTVYTFLPLDSIFVPFIGVINFGSLGLLLGIVWIVGVMNAINLIDGLDSLAGGIALIAMVGLLIQSWITNDLMFVTLALTLIFAIAGFLNYNFYPAKVFMGDGGALFLGYLLAVLPLLQIKTTLGGAWSITPVFLLGIPLVDTLFSMLRRFIRGIPLFSADRNHIHHKLIAKGLTHRQAVRRLHIVSIIYTTIFLICLQDLVPLKLGLISFTGISWLLIFFAGYEELVKPMNVLKNRDNIREDRSFLFSFSQNIELFFKQAKSKDDLIFILNIWCQQFDMISYLISGKETKISEQFNPDEISPKKIKTLVFENEDLKIELNFPAKLFDLDSDIKLQSIQNVMNLMLIYLPKSQFKDSQATTKVVKIASHRIK